MTIPCISMHRPWAQWVANRSKTIETRTHKRFKSLEGRFVGIHASAHFDEGAFSCAEPYWPGILQNRELYRETGIIVVVRVKEFRLLTDNDSRAALINCKTAIRYGLILDDDVQVLDKVIKIPGKQSIFYHDVPVKGVA